MTLPLIIQVPAEANAAQWDQIHRALAEHRAASNNRADIVSNFPAAVVSPPEPAKPAELSDLFITTPQPEAVPPVVNVPEPEPIGDPNWLHHHVIEHGAFPQADDGNWQHILADSTVGSKLPPHLLAEYKDLRKDAGLIKARWVRANKRNGNSSQPAPTAPTPATDTMASLGSLFGAQAARPPATPIPSVNVNSVNVASQLTPAQRKAIWDWHNVLTDTRKAATMGWLQGDTFPPTGKPLTLTDLESLDGKLVGKIRREIGKALKLPA